MCAAPSFQASTERARSKICTCIDALDSLRPLNRREHTFHTFSLGVRLFGWGVPPGRQQKTTRNIIYPAPRITLLFRSIEKRVMWATERVESSVGARRCPEIIPHRTEPLPSPAMVGSSLPPPSPPFPPAHASRSSRFLPRARACYFFYSLSRCCNPERSGAAQCGVVRRCAAFTFSPG